MAGPRTCRMGRGPKTPLPHRMHRRFGCWVSDALWHVSPASVGYLMLSDRSGRWRRHRSPKRCYYEAGMHSINLLTFVNWQVCCC
jgi:hypothetical protein